MKANPTNEGKHTSTRVDPDDAPELTEEFFKHGTRRIADHEVTKAEGDAALRQLLNRDQSMP